MISEGDRERLIEIKDEIKDLLEEFKQIIKTGAPKHIFDRAKAYPLAQIDAAIDHEGFTVNTYDVTLQDIIDEIPFDDGEFEDIDEDADEDRRRYRRNRKGRWIMTTEEKAAYIQSQSACAIIEAFGMMTENLHRQFKGESNAYSDQQFQMLINKYGIGHNDVLSFLNK